MYCVVCKACLVEKGDVGELVCQKLKTNLGLGREDNTQW